MIKEDKGDRLVKVYTDGSCSPNPGPGGWAALIIDSKDERILKGFHPSSTNNRMELTAALSALQKINRKKVVFLYTDSEYLRKGITEWIDNWIARNWKRKGGKLANVDLWKALASEIKNRDITWNWVKAHNGEIYNERVDKIARSMTERANQ